MQGVPIDILPFATCVLDKRGIIRGVNDKFAGMLGYEDASIFAGLPLRELVLEKSRQHIEKQMQICIEKGDADSPPQAIYILNCMEEEIQVYCTISYRTVYDRVLLHIVPAVHSTEEPLEERLTSRFVDILLHTPDMHAVFSGFLQVLTDLMGLEFGTVFVRDPVNDVLKIDSSTEMDDELTAILKQEAASQWGMVSKVLLFSRQLEDVGIPPGLRKYGIRTAVLIPVVEGGELYVMYALFSKSRGRFSVAERKSILAAAHPLRMMTVRVLKERELERSETLYRSLIRSMPNGVLVRNRSGKIIHYNLAAARTFGQRNDTTLAPEVLFEGTRIFSEDDVPLSDDESPGMKSLKEGMKIRNREIRVLRADGSSVWLSVNSEPMYGPENRTPYAVVSTFKDVTTTRRIREELEKTREEAVAANRTKSSFLANISHEIRTPLSGIMGMTDILLNSGVPEEQLQQLRMMKDAEETLLDIINKVLELSKIESGKQIMESRPFLLQDCIRKAVYPFGAGAGSDSIELEINIADGIPELLIGDGNSIQQVLINLVGNAMKFTESGTIEISVIPCGTITPRKAPLLFCVKDTGIGISKSDQGRIFDVFQQGDSSFSKRHQGTGLGLSISRQVIELMGGAIWLRSQPGEGSMFCFNLDLGIAGNDEKAVAYIPQSVRMQTSTPLNILLAEDNPLNRQSVSFYLREMGHTCVSVENGDAALEHLRASPADLVLMDIQMPKRNGIETTRRIREGHEPEIRADIPIIALTAYAMKNEIEQITASGMNAYISKPVNRDQLYQLIEKTINHVHSENEQPDEGCGFFETLQLEKVIGGTVDFGAFVDDYRTDLDVARQLLELYIRDVPGRIAHIQDALVRKDSGRLADNFHSLSNNLSAVRLYEIGQETREMERLALSGSFHYIADSFPDLKNRLDGSLDEAERYLYVINCIEKI